MEIKIAKTAGFCFGVKRAIDMAEDLLSKGAKICTLGSLIHNKYVVEKLKKRGVITVHDVKHIPEGYTLVIRSHGATKDEIEYINKNKIPYIDATCPFVKKIHQIVQKESNLGKFILILGDENHPEVVGIKSYCTSQGMVINDENYMERISKIANNSSVIDIAIVAQTTFDIKKWRKYINLIQNLFTNFKIYDTICNTTQLRQKEANKLSKICKCMLVIGGKNSSNTNKLYDICKNNCKSFFIESVNEFNFNCLKNYSCVGITAGASTPQEIIEEVEGIMEKGQDIKESMNFEELLKESFKEDSGRGRVKGVVVSINPTEVLVDVGRKQSGVIPISELTNDPSMKPEDIVKVGDELDLLIMKTNDQEGTITLSKIRADKNNQWGEAERLYKSKEVITGVVKKVVKSGVLAEYKSMSIFIPSSHLGGSKEIPFEYYLNKEVRMKIIEADQYKGRIVGSIREVMNQEKEERLEEFWNNIEVGKKYKGVVKSITSYAAFVSLGCIDGMVHISELTWDRSKIPSDIVSVGQEVEVFVKSFDKEKGKVSLIYKKDDENPWNIVKNNYYIGKVFDAKIVNIVAFGAFAEIVPGVDGFIHISQMADHRIESPKEVISVGDKVKVQIKEIDIENKRISLTMNNIILDDE